jgi:penicillin amidase
LKDRGTSVRLVKRVVIVLLVVVVVGLAAGAGALVWITNRAMPQTTGTLTVTGLDAAVAVDRDAAGFAHITATTPHDLFVAQGYVHAQERMWQMEVWRRISAGRLSELFGAGSLEEDRYIRTLGWRRAAERDLAGLSTETRALLDAYAAGVNAWLDANRGNLGLAFVITGANPEPWTVLDTLTWGKVQAWNLAGNMSSEVFRFLADARLGDPTSSSRPGSSGRSSARRRTSSPSQPPPRNAGRPRRRPASRGARTGHRLQH